MHWIVWGEWPCKKAKVEVSSGKVMVTIFWNNEGVILTRYPTKDGIITAAYYYGILCDLRETFHCKKVHKFCGPPKNVMLLNNNTHPHSACMAQDLLSRFGRTIFSHPPYSPDLAPSYFWPFPILKRRLGGERFQTDAEVQSAVDAFFQKNPTEFYTTGIPPIVERYTKCIDQGGDYVEK